jgi:hypothetical protein
LQQRNLHSSSSSSSSSKKAETSHLLQLCMQAMWVSKLCRIGASSAVLIPYIIASWAGTAAKEHAKQQQQHQQKEVQK